MHHSVGLIGAGIGGSLSPALHEREAGALGLQYTYELIDIDVLGLPAEAVGRLLDDARARGLRGVNVTHPCKQLVMAHLDALDPTAARIGAVNTVLFGDGRTTGFNTDCSGFEEGFRRGLPGARRERVVLVGAGGAGSAVGHALRALGVGELTVVDLDRGRAEALAAPLGARAAEPAQLPALLAVADGMVNATPVGMLARPGSPVPAELLHPGLWVADVIYTPLETELLRQAREAGCRTLNGGGMVVFQAARALALFTGREPDPERMLRHFQELACAAP